MPLITASVGIFGASLLSGAGVAILCQRSSGQTPDDLSALLAFFMSLAAVFGIAGAYLGCRHITGRAPLWAVFVAIGTFAVVLPLATSPNTMPVMNWIAGLAACCAGIATTFAGTIRYVAASKSDYTTG
ncbi:hypothetical protein [Rhodopirellula sp. SWK7]|uniref:hypothetical protein n=1 Tax=Rhodopirellula sp. SWK7 TaxID=595460 RepID=UPI00034D47A0|nr:hypothetical protein [Rhodopirellula sp. SWK7]